MVHPALRARLDQLVRWQNADGGWGYFPGRTSWMEPSFYSCLALHGLPDYAEPVTRAWNLLRSWQLPEGGVRPGPVIAEPNWVTALWLSLHCVRGEFGNPFELALDWLLRTPGADGKLWRRLVSRTAPQDSSGDSRRFGWAWYPETSSWVEPTAHSLVAMRKIARAPSAKSRSWDLRKRIATAEAMLVERRCHDGGWNYGARAALGKNLASYPECTGIALLGLQGSTDPQLPRSLERARKYYDETRSPLARAWLGLSLRLHRVEAAPDTTSAGNDILVFALQTLAHPEGNAKWLDTTNSA